MCGHVASVTKVQCSVVAISRLQMPGLTEPIMSAGPFAEAVRGSPIYNMFARLRGMTVGKGAFLDSVRLLDYELASFGENAIVSRNALVYCHLASHKKGKLVVYQKRSTFGANCILGARSITLPGYSLADKATLAPVTLGAPAMSF